MPGVISEAQWRAVQLLILAYVGFISLGLPDGLLGVGWPSMRADFGEPAGAVGLVLFATITGYLLSSLATGFAVSRLGVGRLLAGSTALTALAMAAFGLSPALVATVAAGFALGIGQGAIDAGLNAHAARHFSARHMNWLHASFGFGATLGPLIMTGLIAVGLTWRAGYGAVAVAQALLTLAFVATVGAWPNGRGRAPEPPATTSDAVGQPAARSGVRSVLGRLPVWQGAAAFAVYAGVEMGAGLWAYTFLTEARGVSEGPAGLVVSAYWASLFVGRLAIGVVADRVGTHRVLLGCLAALLVGVTLVALPGPAGLAVVGFMVAGLAAAPVFPLLTHTTAARVGDTHADRAVGVQVAAASLGGAGLASTIGVIVTRLGAGAIGPTLVVLAVALSAIYLSTGQGASVRG